MQPPLQYAGPVRIPPPTMQLRVRRETSTYDTVNARQFEHWQTDLPIQQPMVYNGERHAQSKQKDAVYYDMAPMSSRTDKRNFRQAQSFIADGPPLAENPYFNRYDPTRDPRNAVRELRSAVFEEKDPERGVEESKRILQRGLTSRWLPESKETQEILMAYEQMKPKIDDPAVNFHSYKK